MYQYFIIDTRQQVIGVMILPFRESLLETTIILSDTKWVHVGVIWNYDMSSVRVLIDGELKNDLVVSSLLLSNGSVAVHSNALEGKMSDDRSSLFRGTGNKKKS